MRSAIAVPAQRQLRQVPDSGRLMCAPAMADLVEVQYFEFAA